jgi:hypothetical protein
MNETEQATDPVKYRGTDNYGKPKSAYLSKLTAMTNKELLRETKDRIWFSAYANNNPRSDYHWQCDACYDECHRRGRSNIYTLAHQSVVKEVNDE